MKDLGLVRYDAMRHAIVACASVDEVKEIRDRARAMEVYAAQALNTESERKACEIRIRAERRVGQMLKEMKDRGERQKNGSTGGNNKKRTSHEATFAPNLRASPGCAVNMSIGQLTFRDGFGRPTRKPMGRAPVVGNASARRWEGCMSFTPADREFALLVLYSMLRGKEMVRPTPDNVGALVDFMELGNK